MPKISFADLEKFKPHQGKYVREAMRGVPGRKARVKYFSKYMPVGAARRLANIFTITKKTKRFNEGVHDALKKLNKDIKFAMKANKYTREQAIQSVWRRLKEKYQTYMTIESSRDLFQAWLNDVVESP